MGAWVVIITSSLFYAGTGRTIDSCSGPRLLSGVVKRVMRDEAKWTSNEN